MYIAIMQTVMLIGPGLGLVLFSFCLRLNEDPWCKFSVTWSG